MKHLAEWGVFLALTAFARAERPPTKSVPVTDNYGERAIASDSVTVNYRGWLDDDTEFDSSYKRDEPISFPLGGRHPRLDRRDAACRCRRNNRTGDSR